MSDKKRTNRKRKAKEADIYQFDTGDPKRLKLSSPIRNNHQTNNNSNNPNHIIIDPFASFAKKSNGFSSLIHPSSPFQTPNIDHQKPEKEKEKKQEESKVEKNKNNKNNQLKGFGSFGEFDNAADIFSSWNNNNNKNKNNNNSERKNNEPNAWGNSNGNEFKFGENASQFSMADLGDGDNKNNNDNNDEESVDEFEEEKPVATLGGKIDAGDSHDKTIFNMKCIVYELDVEHNCYKEKGIGEVKLNTYSLDKNQKKIKKNDKVHARLLCRKDVTFKTLMNAVLMKETKFDKANEKSIRFTVFEQQQIAKGKDKHNEIGEIVNVAKSYLLKSKETDKKKINAFLAKIKEIQQKM